jgi:hypothetical protein
MVHFQLSLVFLLFLSASYSIYEALVANELERGHGREDCCWTIGYIG